MPQKLILPLPWAIARAKGYRLPWDVAFALIQCVCPCSRILSLHRATTFAFGYCLCHVILPWQHASFFALRHRLASACCLSPPLLILPRDNTVRQNFGLYPQRICSRPLPVIMPHMLSLSLSAALIVALIFLATRAFGHRT